MYSRYTDILNELAGENNLRHIPALLPRQVTNLCSNDYLGLNNDKALRNEFLQYLAQSDVPFSAVSSRLLTGNSAEYETLESAIASAYNCEACLVFNSGYHANIGILPSLAAKGDVIVADKLVHASIIDGMHLSKAEKIRYNHLDYNHLESILQKNRNTYKQVFIVTESIFSMDGDVANLETLVSLKKKYNCFLYLDEAHALGVRGAKGLGCAEEAGLVDQCDFIVGTFGKALASVGAYVVCNNAVKQYLVNTSRSFIYTTALPPVNLAWTHFLFQKLPFLDARRNHLKQLGTALAKGLDVPFSSHIVPFVTGSNESAIALSGKMLDAGIYVLPIRYPTVPAGKARLRFSLHAGLEMNDIRSIIQTIAHHAAGLVK